MNTMPPVLVLGLGASGVAAARLLRREGRAVVAQDRGATPALQAVAARLREEGVVVRVGEDALPRDAVAQCIVSPGIPADGPWVTELRARGVPVLAEAELGWSRRGASRVLAVTGSNGKSSCVRLCRDALEAAGWRAVACANYGRPLCDVVADEPSAEVLVAEISSFQLETTVDFRPEAGILLNVLPNHLDRHGDMAAYQATKMRLAARQTPADTFVLPAALHPFVETAAVVRTFGASTACDYRLEGATVRRRDGATLSLTGSWFDGPVYGQSAAAAWAALDAFGAPLEALASALRRFKPLAHRMQLVAEVRGVRFVDDSKATNLAALAAAVVMTDGPVRLLCGGRLKETLSPDFKNLLDAKVVCAYCVGESGPAFTAALRGIECGSLECAVARAWGDARAGETILLSPGCASFDQFNGYAERGDAFARHARAIAKEIQT